MAESTPSADPRLILPLDMPTRGDAERLIERLDGAITFYKIGLQLLASEGMALARDLKGQGQHLFLDWKLHDIGATVEKATAAIIASGACDLLTVHGEPQVLKAAVRGRDGDKDAKILGVTVMTSLTEDDLKAMGYGLGVQALVERRIRQCIDAGADGVIASPHEATMARQIGGEDFWWSRRACGPPGRARTIRLAPRPRPRRSRPAPAIWCAVGRSPPRPIRARPRSRSSLRWRGSDRYFFLPPPLLQPLMPPEPPQPVMPPPPLEPQPQPPDFRRHARPRRG